MKKFFAGLVGFAGIIAGVGAVSADTVKSEQIEFFAVVPLKVESCSVVSDDTCSTTFGGPVSAILNGGFLIGDPTRDLAFDVNSADTPGLLFFTALTLPGNGTLPFTDFFSLTDFDNANAPPSPDFGFSLKGTYVAPTQQGGSRSIVLDSFSTFARYTQADGTILTKETSQDSIWSYAFSEGTNLKDNVALSLKDTGPITAMAQVVPGPAPVPVPATLPLALTGFLLLGWLARPNRKA